MGTCHLDTCEQGRGGLYRSTRDNTASRQTACQVDSLPVYVSKISVREISQVRLYLTFNRKFLSFPNNFLRS